MAFLVSPGVQVREIDVSNVVPAVSSSIGGYVGSFSWGPVDEVRTIISEKDLVSVFGDPSNDDTYLTSAKKKEHFYSAANFLKYGNNLKVVRAVSTNMLNASTGSAGLLVKNATHYYDNNYHTGAAASNVGDFVARCVGVLGNSLKVSVCASANAFSQSAATTVNDSSIALGDTSMTVASGAALVVGDIVTFGSDINKYIISEINTNDITFALASDGSSGLQTVVANSANVNREWEFASNFTKAPGSSPDAIANSSSLDEIHIAVIDEDGLITGIVGEVLEIYEGVSMASDAKDSEGSSNYFVDKLRYNSNYIFFSNHNSNLSESGNTFAVAGAIFDTHTLPITQSFTNGSDGYCLTAGQKKSGIESYLGDAETQDVDFLISGPLVSPANTTLFVVVNVSHATLA